MRFLSGQPQTLYRPQHLREGPQLTGTLRHPQR